jgi:hypothetical protein
VKLGNKQLVEKLTRFRDLSRLRPRVFRDDRDAVGDATGPALATCSSWRSERESVLRINGAFELRLRRLLGSATKAHRKNWRPLPRGYLFCRTV